MTDPYQDASLPELFLLEAQAQTQQLDQGLISLSVQASDKTQLEQCMRAAHSLKGAARLVGVEPAVGVAHEMEELLVAALRGTQPLQREQIRLLMQGSAAILTLAEGKTVPELAKLVSALASRHIAPVVATEALTSPEPAAAAADPESALPALACQNSDEMKRTGTLRVSSERIDLLLDLAGRLLVVSKNSPQFAYELMRIKKLQRQAKKHLESLKDRLIEQHISGYFATKLMDIEQLLSEAAAQTQRCIGQYDSASWDTQLLNQQLYDAALACRMRPFSDLFSGKARMVFDLASQLNKQVQLIQEGETTSVDRDMLERLEAPLVHLIRNAVDHGIELPDERRLQHKPALATIRLKAWHASGYLYIEVRDDGRGVDIEKIKTRVLSRQLATADAVNRMNEQELLAFIFLPDFSLANQVTDISGRGVGLNAVQHDIKALGGEVALFNQPGQGCCFQLRLPVAVSVVRCVIVEVAAEIYAVPLHQIDSMLRVSPDDLVMVEGQPHFWWNGEAIVLLKLAQLLGLHETNAAPQDIGVLIFQERGQKIAAATTRLLGEQSLVVLHMDARFGHLSAIMAGAVLADGTPTLILDIDGVLAKAHTLLKQGTVNNFSAPQDAVQARKVLVVDDSLTVRELERKLLSNRGYQVKVAVDGLQGWTMLRAESFDLLVTDIDMPKMDGIELVRLVRADSRLNRLPVIVVSYKDREEDKNRGLEAGADFYLAKSSFHDESLLDAVQMLIGSAL